VPGGMYAGRCGPLPHTDILSVVARRMASVQADTSYRIQSINTESKQSVLANLQAHASKQPTGYDASAQLLTSCVVLQAWRQLRPTRTCF
jgi:hypothetical protein